MDERAPGGTAPQETKVTRARNLTWRNMVVSGFLIATLVSSAAFFIVAQGMFLQRPLFATGLLVGGLAVVLFLWLIFVEKRTGLSAERADKEQDNRQAMWVLRAGLSAFIVASVGIGLVGGRSLSPSLGFSPLAEAKNDTVASEEVETAIAEVEDRCAEVEEALLLEVTQMTLTEVFGGFEARYFETAFETPVNIEMIPGLGLVIAERSRGDGGSDFFSRFSVLQDPSDTSSGAEDLAMLEGVAVIDLLWVEELGALFWSYLDQDDEGVVIALARSPLAGGEIDLEAAETIFETSPRVLPVHIVQHGGRIAYSPEVGILLSVGDLSFVPSRLSEQRWLQDREGLALAGGGYGGTYAIDPETLESRQFTSGHRNIQGLVFDPQTGIIWANEHGPNGGDELNKLLDGRDYGWAESTFGKPYDGLQRLRDDGEFRAAYLEEVGLTGLDRWCADPGNGFESPYALFAADGVAPSQLAILEEADRGQESSTRRLIMGTLANESLWVADIVGEDLENWKRVSIGERVRDLLVTPEGNIVLGFDSGRLMLISDSSEE